MREKIERKNKVVRAKKTDKKYARIAKKAKKTGKQEEKISRIKGAVFNTVVENSKYAPAQKFQAVEVPSELPQFYGQDKITLLVRDPNWIFCYWELILETIEKIRHKYNNFSESKFVLRVYDVTGVDFNGSNSNSLFDITINAYANSWYINTVADRSFCVDLGLLFPDGEFVMVLRSNTVRTPPEYISELSDEDWMIPEEIFKRLYAMGFGLGKSSPLGKAWQERIKHIISSSMGSIASPVKIPGRNFWLKVDCELIVYGATEPDALVTVGQEEIKLRSDGTFSLRFALPDGTVSIPVKAVSADRKEERLITPVVERNTK